MLGLRVLGFRVWGRLGFRVFLGGDGWGGGGCLGFWILGV